MDKKKIAFVLGDAMVGGVESALKQILRLIDTERYDVYLFTNVSGNPCVDGLREAIHLIDLDEMDLRKCFFEALKKCNLIRALFILDSYVRMRFAKSNRMKIFYSCRPFKLSTERFDCAIAYKQDYLSMIEVLFHMEAKRKAIWVHGLLWGGYDPNKEYLSWIKSFDKTFCVSHAVKMYCEKLCPELKGKVETFYNIIDSTEIVRKAENCLKTDKCIVLTTVGRLSSEKGQEIIPLTVRYLLDAGYQVKWYIVGDGALKRTVEDKCREYGVTKDVVLTGTQSNPYPYIKNCDIYVQTSYAEGWGLTVQEAKILHKPIVTTDIPVMREQIEHMKNGYITERISPEALFEGIKTLLDNPALCEKFANELKKESHDNSQELEKLYAFIES